MHTQLFFFLFAGGTNQEGEVCGLSYLRLMPWMLEACWRLYAVNANRDRGFASDWLLHVSISRVQCLLPACTWNTWLPGEDDRNMSHYWMNVDLSLSFLHVLLIIWLLECSTVLREISFTWFSSSIPNIWTSGPCLFLSLMEKETCIIFNSKSCS